MSLVLIGQSTTEPVTVSEAKNHLRIDVSDDDVYLETLITVARHQAENYTLRALIPSTWDLVLDEFPDSTVAIELPRPPLSTVSTSLSITYVEDTTAGNTTTVASTGYTIDTDTVPGRVYPSYDNEWPDDVRDQLRAVRVRFASGYASTSIPKPVKQWILMRVGMLYENREASVDSREQIAALPHFACNGLLDPYVVYEK